MNLWRIPLYKIFWDEKDVIAVSEIVRKGMHWAIGDEIASFEQKIAEFVDVKYAVAFNSGTSALHALMIAYGLKSSDEVIVPSFTFVATANAPLFVGAKPVFADIEPETFGLDENSVLEKINGKTKAIVPIHYGGLPCRSIKALKEITEDKGILLIEDAAEALGARVDCASVGTFGDSTMLSFCANKIITTGEGGMSLTNSREIRDKRRLIRSHGREENESYFTTAKSSDYVSLGFNWRMPTIAAALGLAQFEKIAETIKMRRKNANYLTKRLRNLEDITTPNTPDDFYHVFQMYTIRVRRGKATRDKLKGHLAKRKIMSKVYFEPVHLTTFYREKLRYKIGELPKTEKIAGEVLTLPMYPSLKEVEMNFIAKGIEEFFAKNS